MEYKLTIKDSEDGLAVITVYSRSGGGDWTIWYIMDMVEIDNGYFDNAVFIDSEGERIYPEIIDLREARKGS